MRHALLLLALPLASACTGTLITTDPDAGPPPPPGDDAAAPTTPTPTDARVVLPDAGGLVVVAPEDDAGAPPPPPPTSPGGLADDLRITDADLFQTVRVPILEDGAPADRDDLPVIAGRDAMVRVHAEALVGWREREITAVLEVETSTGVRRFVDRRVPTLPSRLDDPDSGFAIRVPGDAIGPDARFRLRLEAEGGPEEAAGATYPAFGAWAALDAEVAPPLVLVLVPFRYDTDGSGRVPDLGADYLERLRAELTSRLPYAEVEIRVHEVVPWDQPDRYNGNVDWGDVNAELIDLRDEEGAPSREYWYGLVAAARSRGAYCDKTWGSCVTGQAYVATIGGSRVGSGVGFTDAASILTISHELGHMHGRYHAPCGTSGESGYPYSRGRIGVWGWDHRDGSWHDPDVATDIMGYCDDEWISDYTFRAMHERSEALRGSAIVAGGPAVPRRFVTVEGGAARWGRVRALRALPGESIRGAFVDDAGAPIEAVDVGRLEPAHEDGATWVVPADAPAGATAIVVDGRRIALP